MREFEFHISPAFLLVSAPGVGGEGRDELQEAPGVPFVGADPDWPVVSFCQIYYHSVLPTVDLGAKEARVASGGCPTGPSATTPRLPGASPYCGVISITWRDPGRCTCRAEW